MPRKNEEERESLAQRSAFRCDQLAARETQMLFQTEVGMRFKSGESTPLGNDTVIGKYRGSIHQFKICPNANMSLFQRMSLKLRARSTVSCHMLRPEITA